MTCLVTVRRETEHYGRPIREEWRAVLDDGEVTVNLRVYPERGSNQLFSTNDLPLGEVPNDVAATMVSELGTLADLVDHPPVE